MRISYYLRASDRDSRGYAPVYLRISHRGTQRYISPDLKVLAGRWSAERQEVSRSHPDAERLNAFLGRTLSEARALVGRMRTKGMLITADRVRERLAEELFAEDGAEDELDFLAFVDREIEGYRRREQRGTYKAYSSVWKKFKAFYEAEYGRRDLPFPRVDVRLLRDFRTYCYEVRGNNPNTTGKALSILRTFVRAAMKEGYISRADYPFEHITIDSNPVDKEKLTPAEIEQIEALDLSADGALAETRRWFLWAYYSGGMRFSDVATLQRKHIRGGRIYYRMEKTSDRVGVPLVDAARAILDYYDDRPTGKEAWVFPIMDGIDPGDGAAIHRRKERQNALANKRLQEIAEAAEIDQHISFHLARNAAAWKAYTELGDIYKVSKFLGHSSVQQTEKYLQGFEDDSLDDDFRSVF